MCSGAGWTLPGRPRGSLGTPSYPSDLPFSDFPGVWSDPYLVRRPLVEQGDGPWMDPFTGRVGFTLPMRGPPSVPHPDSPLRVYRCSVDLESEPGYPTPGSFPTPEVRTRYGPSCYPSPLPQVVPEETTSVSQPRPEGPSCVGLSTPPPS